MTHLDDDDHAFARARPRLLGLAYRLLGSRASAEDAVRDPWLKWRASASGVIDNRASAWLTTVCTRRCIDTSKKVVLIAWSDPLQATSYCIDSADRQRA